MAVSTSHSVAAPHWSQKITRGARLPWVARVRVEWRESGTERIQSVRGTAILVDERHLLTCFHVVHPQASPYLEEGERLVTLESRGAERLCIEVDVGRETHATAHILAEDDRFDMALLRLSSDPLLGLAAPLAPCRLPHESRPVWIAGFLGDPDYVFTVTRLDLDPSQTTSAKGRSRNGTHHFGVEAGYSGGPILADLDGYPVFVGMVELGGKGSPTGTYVAADTVRDFLARNHITPRAAEGSTALDQWCRQEGLASRIACPLPDLLADHRLLPTEQGSPLVYHATHPITSAAVRANARPADTRLAAHLPDPTAIAPLLERMRRETTLPVRLPTEKEFRHLCERGSTAARVIGRPTTIDDYRDGSDELRAPPDTSAEWVECNGRRFLLLCRDDEFYRFESAEALARRHPGLRAVVRTVVSTGVISP